MRDTTRRRPGLSPAEHVELGQLIRTAAAAPTDAVLPEAPATPAERALMVSEGLTLNEVRAHYSAGGGDW